MFLFSLVGLGMVNILATLVGKSFLSAGYTTQPSVERMRQSLRPVVESFLPGGPGAARRRMEDDGAGAAGARPSGAETTPFG